MPSRRSDILLAFAIAAFLFLCWEIRSTLLIIYLSIVFAIVFTPAVRKLKQVHIGKWHPSSGLSVLLLITIALLVLVGFGFLIIPSVSNDLESLTGQLPERLGNLRSEVSRLPYGQHLASGINAGSLESKLGAVMKGALASVSAVTSTLTNLALLVILTAYFIVEGARSFRWSMTLFPLNQRARLSDTLQRAAVRMQKWLTGQTLLMVILGSSSLITFWALGIPYHFALGFFAGVANFVPVLGPIATVLLAGAVAATVSWMKLLGVLIFYLVYQQVENSYLTPRIMQSTVELPAVAVIVALAIGGALAGIAGALVAVPSAALVATLVDEYLADPGKTLHLPRRHGDVEFSTGNSESGKRLSSGD